MLGPSTLQAVTPEALKKMASDFGVKTDTLNRYHEIFSIAYAVISATVGIAAIVSGGLAASGAGSLLLIGSVMVYNSKDLASYDYNNRIYAAILNKMTPMINDTLSAVSDIQGAVNQLGRISGTASETATTIQLENEGLKSSLEQLVSAMKELKRLKDEVVPEIQEATETHHQVAKQIAESAKKIREQAEALQDERIDINKQKQQLQMMAQMATARIQLAIALTGAASGKGDATAVRAHFETLQKLTALALRKTQSSQRAG